MSIDLETQLLGKCLVSPDAVNEVAGILRNPDIFTTADYRAVYEAILSLHNQCYEVDVISVNNELLKLKGDRPGSRDPLTDGWLTLLADIATQHNYFTGTLTRACYFLMEKAMVSHLTRLMVSAQRELQFPDANPFKVMDSLTERFSSWQNRITSLKEKSFAEVLTEVVLETEASAMKPDSTINGISTGLRRIDDYTKGLQPSTLVVLAARPRVGKTALAAQIQYNVSVIQSEPTAYFTLEVTAKQYARRILSIDTQFKTAQIKSGKYADGARIDISRLADSAGRLGSAPLWVYDRIKELSHLVAKIRQAVRENGVKVVFIDQATLVEADGRDPRTRMSNVTRTLKLLANELNICIFLLSQINREADKSGNPRPKMDQLKESSSLEEDADMVWLLFRPALHNLKDDAGMPYDESVFEWMIPKNREGSAHNEGESETLWCDLSTNRILNNEPANSWYRPVESAGF